MPVCPNCKSFVYRTPPAKKEVGPTPEPRPVAQCSACNDVFYWLPPNFDMKHRFNATTHEFCGGQVETLPQS